MNKNSVFPIFHYFLFPDYVLPDGFNPLVVERVAEAVAAAWNESIEG